MRTLLGQALQRPVTPWENPNLIALAELMQRNPDGVVKTLEETISALDLSDHEAQVTAQRAVQLLGCIQGPSVLKEFAALNARWKAIAPAPLREVVITALDSCPVRPLTTLIRERTADTIAMLTTWMMTENDPDVLRLGLTILSTHSSVLNSDLVRRVATILPEDDIAVAVRKARINALTDDQALYLEAKTWIEEIIARIQRGESQSARESESDTDVIHFVFRKLHDHPAAVKGHAADFGRLMESVEQRSLDITRELDTAATDERKGRLRIQGNQATLIRDYLVTLVPKQ
jgi:hypothetical protein